MENLFLSSLTVGRRLLFLATWASTGLLTTWLSPEQVEREEGREKEKGGKGKKVVSP